MQPFSPCDIFLPTCEMLAWSRLREWEWERVAPLLDITLLVRVLANVSIRVGGQFLPSFNSRHHPLDFPFVPSSSFLRFAPAPCMHDASVLESVASILQEIPEFQGIGSLLYCHRINYQHKMNQHFSIHPSFLMRRSKRDTKVVRIVHVAWISS